MVGNTRTSFKDAGTSLSSTDQTNLSYTEGTSPFLLRRSFDIPRKTLDLYISDHRSLSDSELEKFSSDSSSITSEFLDLPKRLTVRLASPPRCRVDTENLYLDLLKDKSNRSQTHSLGQIEHAIDSPKIELGNIDVVIDDIEGNEGIHPPELYVETDSVPDSDADNYIARNSNLWINLDPNTHALLSPRSSNGSICSYRSSNADSAIEILTPDEEIHEPCLSEGSDARLWESKEKSKTTEIHELYGESVEGATHDHHITHSSPIAEDNSYRMCSSSANKDTKPSPPSQIFRTATQQTSCHTTKLPSPIRTNKGREVLPRPPSVVISDFSSKISLENKCSQTLPSSVSASAQGDFLDDRFLFFHRSFSNSSISSNESSVSMLSDSSQEVDEQADFPIRLPRKVSKLVNFTFISFSLYGI